MNTPFPDECPLCNAEMRCPPFEKTETDYAQAEYACGLIVLRYDSGKLEADFPCRWSTVDAIEDLNRKAGFEPTPQAGDDPALASTQRQGE